MHSKGKLHGGSQPARMKNETNYGNCRKEEKAVRGQTIRTETSPDRSSHMVNKGEALMGRTMKGGYDDVSHSLGGAGKVQTYNDKKPSRTEY